MIVGIIVLFSVLCLVVVVAIVYAVIREPLAGAAAAIIAAVLAGITLFFGGYNPVGTKEIGVVESFGHIDGVVGSGFHWMTPWKNVIPIDETVQTDTWKQPTPGNPVTVSTGPSGDVSDCLPVRLGGQQEGCMDMKMKWRILDAGAPELFKNYSRSGDFMETVRTAVVWYQLQQVVNHVLGDYNPIFDVSASSQSGASGASQFTGFEPQILSTLQSDLSGQIDVLSMSLQYLHYDASTQARLNQIQQQYALTAIAQAQYATNTAQARANGQISRALTPSVLVNECLNIAEQALKAGNTSVQPGLCFGGSSGVIANLGKG